MLETVLFLHWYKTKKVFNCPNENCFHMYIYIDVACSLRSNSALAHVTIFDFDRCAAKSYATSE
jgi:hypothetical protein